MNIDFMLKTLFEKEVEYILIGGVNFLLRHQPVLTFDMDIWIRDSRKNRSKTNEALLLMGAQWGKTECDFGPIAMDPKWLETQALYCLYTPHGNLDIFREVKGLENRFEECWNESGCFKTPSGLDYRSLSDQHMLECQEVLSEGERKKDRETFLKKIIGQT